MNSTISCMGGHMKFSPLTSNTLCVCAYIHLQFGSLAALANDYVKFSLTQLPNKPMLRQKHLSMFFIDTSLNLFIDDLNLCPLEHWQTHQPIATSLNVFINYLNLYPSTLWLTHWNFPKCVHCRFEFMRIDTLTNQLSHRNFPIFFH